MDRRELLIGAGAIAAAGLVPAPVHATPEMMTSAIEKALAGRVAKPGRIKLEISPLAENGNSVPVTINVESPMTGHGTRLQLLVPAGRARVQTSVRLATTQRLQAIAIMNDGSAWMDSAEVIVTMSACLDAG